jgi:hypothetical protein
VVSMDVDTRGGICTIRTTTGVVFNLQLALK